MYLAKLLHEDPASCFTQGRFIFINPTSI